MQQIDLKNLNRIKEQYLATGINCIYGAGATGRQVLQLMRALSVQVHCFIDDNASMWGKSIHGVEVAAPDDIKANAKESRNILLGMLYEGYTEEQFKDIPADRLFNPLSLYREVNGEYIHLMLQKVYPDIWQRKMNAFKQVLQDEESLRIVHVMEMMARAQTPSGTLGKPFSPGAYSNIRSQEEQYLTEAVRRYLPEEAVIVDCGAYTGDLIDRLEALAISVSKVFLFEAGPTVYKELKKRAEQSPMMEKLVPIHAGVWSDAGEMGFACTDESLAGGYVSTGGGRPNISVPVCRLDDAIQCRIDFLKMDIEGAELPALKGAERHLLEDRPILAISIYHTLNDSVDIPEYLMEVLPNYQFSLKHHSSGYDDTILYGFPRERINR